MRGGAAEAEVPQVVHREAVDLSHHVTGNVNHNGAFGDQPPYLFLNQVEPVELLVQGLFHVVARNPRVSFFAGPVVGLNEQVLEQAEPRGQFGLVGHQPGPVLYYASYPAAVAMKQALSVASAMNKPKVIAHAVGCQVYLGVELGLHLEHLPEVLPVVGG